MNKVKKRFVLIKGGYSGGILIRWRREPGIRNKSSHSCIKYVLELRLVEWHCYSGVKG